MGTYAFANGSGSVGKTTSAVTLGVQLALEGIRTRMIDLDHQANATIWTGYPDPQGVTGADVLRMNATIAQAERPARLYLGGGEYEEIENLTIVPAEEKAMAELVIELGRIAGGAGTVRLRNALREAKQNSPVDVTLIDCPGALNEMAIAGILATTVDESDDPEDKGNWGVITCTKPAVKENSGIPRLMEELRTMSNVYGTDIPLLSVIPCAVPGQGKTYDEQMEFLVGAFQDAVTPKVRRASIVDTAYAQKAPIPLFGYEAKVIRDDYKAVLQHMRGHGLFRPAA